MTGDTLATDLLRHPRLAAPGEREGVLTLRSPEGQRDHAQPSTLGRGLWVVAASCATLHALADAGWQLDLDSLATAGVLLGALRDALVALGWRLVHVTLHADGSVTLELWCPTTGDLVRVGPTLAHAAGRALLAVEPLSEVGRG